MPSGISKANSNRKNNKARVARRAKSYANCQERNRINRDVKGGHRKVGVYKRKINSATGGDKHSKLTVKPKKVKQRKAAEIVEIASSPE